MILQANTRKTELTLSAASKVQPERVGRSTARPRSFPALIAGAAPNTVGVIHGATRLCGTCVTLIREWQPGVWRHCAVGFDHVPDVGTYPGITADVVLPWSCHDCRLVNWPHMDGSPRTLCAGCGSPPLTELERRALAGDR